MTKLFLGILLFASVGLAQDGTPFLPEQAFLVKGLKDKGESQKVQKMAKFIFDFAVDGGTVAAHATGVYLPKNALIRQSWFYVNTQFVDAGTGTVAVSCEDADNIFTAADFTGNSAGAIVAGNNTGAASTMVAGIAAPCNITVTLGGAAITAGKLTGFVEYVTVD